MKNEIIGRCWPSYKQELLLKAIFSKGVALEKAWKQWREAVDIENLDPGDYRLLSLLYENLKTSQIQDPVMGRLKGVYRYTWSQNQLLFHQMKKVIEALKTQKISCLLLKGAALTCLYYKNLGLRAMSDFDILVPLSQVEEAIEVLKTLNYYPKYCLARSFKLPSCSFFQIFHSQGFKNSHQQELDLHWNILTECCQVNEAALFWEKAIPLDFQGLKTYALNPTDQLFHTCIHGARWNSFAPYRWIPDAVTLIHQAPIEWKRLLELGKRYQVTLPLQDTFHCLSEQFKIPIPLFFLKQLQESSYSKREKVEYLHLTKPKKNFLDTLISYWHRHSRFLSSHHFFYKLIYFPFFIQNAWQLSSVWQIPFYAVSQSLRKWRQQNKV